MPRITNFVLVPILAFYALVQNCFAIIQQQRQNSHGFSLAQNSFRYSGYYQDLESKFYYLKARYYSPKLEQFISRDTYDLSNKYAYCDGNPISNIDLSGHMSQKVEQACSVLTSILDFGNGWGASLSLALGLLAQQDKSDNNCFSGLGILGAMCLIALAFYGICPKKREFINWGVLRRAQLYAGVANPTHYSVMYRVDSRSLEEIIASRGLRPTLGRSHIHVALETTMLAGYLSGSAGAGGTIGYLYVMSRPPLLNFWPHAFFRDFLHESTLPYIPSRAILGYWRIVL